MSAVRMRKQDVRERVKNFDSVALGYTEEEAIDEAKRCLQCKKPVCVEGCPVEIDIPAFIKFIAKGDFKAAIDKIKEKNNLPAICGRVCPQETQCQGVCVLANKGESINVGALERFAADWEIKNGSKLPPTPRLWQTSKAQSLQKNKSYGQRITDDGKRIKVAVVGSGPAGLTCAADLAKIGYRVVIFESLHLPGGVLTYGIPEFRLPKKIVKYEINGISNSGVEILRNMVIGKIFTIEELFDKGFKAIFIGSGAGLPQFLGIEGENLNRVYSANEFLTRMNLMKAYLFPEYDTPINIGKRVAVIGGGNVAMDSARVARRIGAEVSVVYRRTEREMPARREEIENAKEEGIEFKLLTTPTKIIGDRDSFVRGMECIRMELGEPDESGRRRPIPIKNSEFRIDADTVIVAIGQNPNPLIPETTPALKTGKRGVIIADKETGQTSIKGVFAGGDITTGSDTVISAMGAGKRTAVAIDKYLRVY